MRATRTSACFLVLLLLATACDDGGETLRRRGWQPSAAPVSPVECPPLPPDADRPKGMIDIELPEGSRFIEPASSLGKGVRADLFVPLPVEDVYRFFLEQARRPSRKIVFNESEGFEAEVFFEEDDGRVGLIRVFVTCNDGSIVSIETFES